MGTAGRLSGLDGASLPGAAGTDWRPDGESGVDWGCEGAGAIYGDSGGDSVRVCRPLHLHDLGILG